LWAEIINVINKVLNQKKYKVSVPFINMKEEKSREIYLLSLVISFLAGIVSIYGAFGLSNSCTNTDGFSSLACSLGFLIILLIVAPIIMILSLIVRIISRYERKRKWWDFHSWIAYALVLVIMSFFEESIPNEVIRSIILIFSFSFVVIPAALYYIYPLEDNIQKKIDKRNPVKKKNSKKIKKKR